MTWTKLAKTRVAVLFILVALFSTGAAMYGYVAGAKTCDTFLEAKQERLVQCAHWCYKIRYSAPQDLIGDDCHCANGDSISADFIPIEFYLRNEEADVE